MTTTQHIIFLTPTPPPTEPGWYWCRYYLMDNDTMPFPREVQLVRTASSDMKQLKVFSGNDVYPVEDYIWFGPLPTVRESQSVDKLETT